MAEPPLERATVVVIELVAAVARLPEVSAPKAIQAPALATTRPMPSNRVTICARVRKMLTATLLRIWSALPPIAEFI